MISRPKIPFELVEEFLFIGNANEVAERVSGYAHNGLEHVILGNATGTVGGLDEINANTNGIDSLGGRSRRIQVAGSTTSATSRYLRGRGGVETCCGRSNPTSHSVATRRAALLHAGNSIDSDIARANSARNSGGGDFTALTAHALPLRR